MYGVSGILFYIIELLLPGLCGILLWLAFRPWRQCERLRRGAEAGPFREGVLLCLFVFLTGLFAITLTPPQFWFDILCRHRIPTFPPPFSGGLNLVPFKRSWQHLQYYLKIGLWEAVLINYPGNIIIFIPVGALSALLMDRPRWWRSTFLAMGLSAFIEVFQLFVSRGTDIDDVILNTLGGLAGYWLFRLLDRLWPRFVAGCKKR